MANQTTTAPVAPQAQEAAPAAVQTQAPAVNEEHSGHGQTWNPKMPEPQIINGVKVYPTSYIPAKAELHAPKPMLLSLDHWHIEAVHIVVFFLVLYFLFIGPWKRPNHR